MHFSSIIAEISFSGDVVNLKFKVFPLSANHSGVNKQENSLPNSNFKTVATMKQ